MAVLCTTSKGMDSIEVQRAAPASVKALHHTREHSQHDWSDVLMQSAPPPEAQQWAQEQQAYKDSVRTSTPATIQNALQNFNGVQINPSKLYAPGAPKSNNAPLTPEQKPQAQPAATPQATPQALGPATVVCELPHSCLHLSMGTRSGQVSAITTPLEEYYSA